MASEKVFIEIGMRNQLNRLKTGRIKQITTHATALLYRVGFQTSLISPTDFKPVN